MTMDIFVNGNAVRTDATHLHAFLCEHLPTQGLTLESAFACAVNNCFAPRTGWLQKPLVSGDRIDIIAPITGG
jgi:thiamine biosynthesis protein ThiS